MSEDGSPCEWLATAQPGGRALVVESTWPTVEVAMRELRDFCYGILGLECVLSKARMTLTCRDRTIRFMVASDPFIAHNLLGARFDRIWGLGYLPPDRAAEVRSRLHI